MRAKQNSRIYWALARDNAVPFSGFFAVVSERLSCPVPATVLVAVIATGLGAIPMGSSTAFLDLTGSFVILTTVSYAIPFIANVLTKRQNFPRGPFHLGRWGTAVNLTAVALISLFNVFYCLREYPQPPCPTMFCTQQGKWNLDVVRRRKSPKTHRRLTSLLCQHSIRHPHHRRVDELQLGGPRRRHCPHHSMVVHPRAAELSGAQGYDVVYNRRPSSRDTTRG